MKTPRRARLLILLGVAFGIAVVGYLHDERNAPLVDGSDRARISTVSLPTVPSVNVVAPQIPQPYPQVPLSPFPTPRVPLPTPEPVVTGPYTLEWEPVGSFFDFAATVEASDPFGERRRYPLGPTKWGIYVVTHDGIAEQVYAARRWIDSLVWEREAGPTATYLTKQLVPSPLLNQSILLEWRGRLEIDARTRHVTDWKAALPHGPFGVDPGSGEPLLRLGGDATDTRILVTMGGPIQGQPGTQYLVDVNGSAKRLVGAEELRPFSLMGNGEALYLHKGLGAGQAAYFAPGRGGEVTQVRNVIGFAIERTSQPSSPGTRVSQPSSPGTRVAMSVSSGRIVDFVPEGELLVFDSNTGQVRNAGPVNPTYVLMWVADSDKVWTGSRLIDVNTGVWEPALSPPTISSQGKSSEVVSPDGRYVARVAEPDITKITADCSRLPLRLEVKDRERQETRVLLECPGGVGSYPIWLNNTKLIVPIPNCWGCGAGSYRILLGDVETGVVRSLTAGLERGARAEPSPDGTRVIVIGESVRVYSEGALLLRDDLWPPRDFGSSKLVWSPDSRGFLEAGSRLRVYSKDGVLLRDHGPPPEGFVFQSPVWAPDGSTYAFLLGPENWSPQR